MTVSKFCKKCGKMMWDVQPCKRFCDTCIKEKARQKAKLNYEKKKAQQQGDICTLPRCMKVEERRYNDPRRTQPKENVAMEIPTQQEL